MDFLVKASFPNKPELKKTFSNFQPSFDAVLSEIELILKNKLQLFSQPFLKSRVKSFESYYKKLVKLQIETEDRSSFPVITDLLGIRIICPFIDDLDVIEKQICALFKVREIERKGADRAFSEFGYESTHLLAEIPADLAEKYSLPSTLVCEIQIRTILQDAWAEVEHELVYKAEFTPFDLPLKRKLASVNASLNLADIIFQEIRGYQTNLNRELEQRRATFYEKADLLLNKAENGDNSDIQSEPFSEPQSSPYVKGTIDDLLLTAIHAHNSGNLEVAVKIYTQILDSQPRPNPMVSSVIRKHRGMAYFAESRYEDALEDFLKSAELDAGGYRACYYAGIVYSLLSNHEAAVLWFTKSLEINEFQSHVYYRRAFSYFHLGDYAASLSDLDKSCALGLDTEECGSLRSKLLQKLKID